MRLLLFPIQRLVTEFAQLASCSTDGPTTMCLHSHSNMLRFDDLQQLMHRWLKTFQLICKNGFRGQAMADATLVLFHVINLNLFTAFDRLECLARGESVKASSENVMELPSNWIRAPKRALMHCGQIFLLLRKMSDAQRPAWSAIAIYRATIVLWAISLSRLHVLGDPDQEKSFDTDINTQSYPATYPPQGSGLQGFFHYENGSAYCAAEGGQLVPLDEPETCLKLGIDSMRHTCPALAFTAGVKIKLETMAAAWEKVPA